MTEYTHADGPGSVHAKLRAPTQIDRQHIDSARRAAEALFAPKRSSTELATPDPALSANELPRKPRVLRAQVQPTSIAPAEPPVEWEPPRPRQQIPATHSARMRTWLKYGMTVRQAAEVYGTSVSDIERLLQEA